LLVDAFEAVMPKATAKMKTRINFFMILKLKINNDF